MKRYRVSGVRITMGARRWLQIMDVDECIALVPYSDRTPEIHAACYADANTIVEALVNRMKAPAFDG